MDLAIDIEFAHPTGDELRVLRTEIEDQNFVFHVICLGILLLRFFFLRACSLQIIGDLEPYAHPVVQFDLDRILALKAAFAFGRREHRQVALQVLHRLESTVFVRFDDKEDVAQALPGRFEQVLGFLPGRLQSEDLAFFPVAGDVLVFELGDLDDYVREADAIMYEEKTAKKANRT